MSSLMTVQASRDLSGPARKGSISVVIPTYNRAHMLAEALNSVLAQTRQPQEILVVDDASSDGTQALLAQWQARDARIVPLVQQVNGGPAACRNRGVAAAHCDYVAFLDSDDRWEPGHLARAAAFLDAEPATDLVFAEVRRVRADGSVLQDTYLQRDKGLHRYLAAHPKVAEGGMGADWRVFAVPEKQVLLQQYCVPIQSTLIRRSVALACPLDPTIEVCEDYDWILRLALAGHRFGFVAAVGCVCVVHDGNLTANGKAELRNCTQERHMWEKLLVRSQAGRAKESGPSESAMVRGRLAGLCLEEGYLQREAGRPAQAAGAYLRSLGYRRSWGAIKGMLLAPVRPRKCQQGTKT